MLETILFDDKGSAWLNSLRRFCLSGVLVPEQNNLVVNVPAMSGSNPGRSSTIPIQGPEDAKSECYSLVGIQGAVNVGQGLVTTVGGVAVTGSGTKFLSQLQVGSVVQVPGVLAPVAVASVTSDTAFTTTVPLPVVTGAMFTFQVPIINDVRDRMFVTIHDQAWRRMLMNRDVPVRHVFGDAQKPLFMKESLLLEVDQTLLFQLTNYSTLGPGSVAPLIEARKWQVESLKRRNVAVFIDGLRQRKTYVNPYWLTLDDGIVTIPAGGAVTKFFTTTGDITCLLFNLYGHAISSGQAGDVQEMVSLEFFDAVNGRALQAQPVTLNTACGDASNAFHLPTPLTCEPASQIMVKMRNLITDQPTDIMLTWHGVAVYTGMAGKGGSITDRALVDSARDMYRSMAPQIVPASTQG